MPAMTDCCEPPHGLSSTALIHVAGHCLHRLRDPTIAAVLSPTGWLAFDQLAVSAVSNAGAPSCLRV